VENIELARRAWEAFSRRDFETQLQYIHPDLEWRPAQGPGGPEGSVYNGREAYARWLYDEVVPVWESFRGEDLEIRELEDGRTAPVGQTKSGTKGDGIERVQKTSVPCAHRPKRHHGVTPHRGTKDVLWIRPDIRAQSG
jgi:hypothetical protein